MTPIELIATLERLIAKKQAIKQGMMQQLLTGRTRLPGFDAAVGMNASSESCFVETGLSGKCEHVEIRHYGRRYRIHRQRPSLTHDHGRSHCTV